MSGTTAPPRIVAYVGLALTYGYLYFPQPPVYSDVFLARQIRYLKIEGLHIWAPKHCCFVMRKGSI